MKIYISGPMTGAGNYMERFCQVEENLVSEHLGIEVMNPARIMEHMPKSTTYEEYMKISLALLDMCDAIYMLEGWGASEGANIEHRFARGKGIWIIYEAEMKDILTKVED